MGRGRTLPLIASVALGLTLLVRLALVLDRLPEQVASHYDFAGRPDGYQSKFEFVCTATLLDLLMLGLVCVLPALIPRVPLRMVNLPHKAYWFAPERRAETEGRLVEWVSWFGGATVALLCGIFELIIRANLQASTLSHQAWLLVASYVLFILFSSAGMAHAFRRP